MHYSYRPPTGAATAVQKQALPRPSDQAPEDYFYSIENQVKRLEEDRISRGEARREAEEKRFEAQKQAADLEAARAQAKDLEQQAENPGYPVLVHPIPPIHRPDRPARPPPHPVQGPLPSRPMGDGR